jgi:hypothetical protein
MTLVDDEAAAEDADTEVAALWKGGLNQQVHRVGA